MCRANIRSAAQIFQNYSKFAFATIIHKQRDKLSRPFCLFPLAELSSDIPIKALISSQTCSSSIRTTLIDGKQVQKEPSQQCGLTHNKTQQLHRDKIR